MLPDPQRRKQLADIVLCQRFCHLMTFVSSEVIQTVSKRMLVKLISDQSMANPIGLHTTENFEMQFSDQTKFTHPMFDAFLIPQRQTRHGTGDFPAGTDWATGLNTNVFIIFFLLERSKSILLFPRQVATTRFCRLKVMFSSSTLVGNEPCRRCPSLAVSPSS